MPIWIVYAQYQKSIKSLWCLLQWYAVIKKQYFALFALFSAFCVLSVWCQRNALQSHLCAHYSTRNTFQWCVTLCRPQCICPCHHPLSPTHKALHVLLWHWGLGVISACCCQQCFLSRQRLRALCSHISCIVPCIWACCCAASGNCVLFCVFVAAVVSSRAWGV